MKHHSAKNTCTALASCALALAALTASAKSWYYNSGDTANNYGLENPSAWVDGSSSPATEFNTGDRYYVKSGANLRFKNGTWNGGEFYFGEPSESADGTKVSYGTHQGGYITFNSVVHFDNGNIRVYQLGDLEQRLDLVLNANSIVVGSPASNPFYFRSGLLNSSTGIVDHRYSNRRLIVNAPISSDSSDVGLRIGGNSSQGTNLVVALTGDCSGYAGTIFVKTYNAAITADGNWDTRLMLGDITVGGTIQMDAKTAIEARTAVRNDWAAGAPSECTVGSLSLAAGSVILVTGETTTPTNGVINVRDSLSVTAPVTVRLNYKAAPTTAGNFVKILTAPAGSSLDAADFSLDLGVSSAAAGYDFRVDVDETTGRKSLVVEFPPVIEQIASYPGEGRKDYSEVAGEGSSLTNALAWSNNDVPGPAYSGYHYYSGTSYDLRTLNDVNADYDFPCLSFTKEGQSKHLVIDTRSFRVPVFNAGQLGCIVWLGKASGITRTLKADRLVNNANPTKGPVDLGAWNSQTMVVDAEVVGSGDFLLQGITGTSATKGNYEFTGLNTNFAGRITVAHASAGIDGRHDFDAKFQTLYVNDGRNLGGAREAFSGRALMLQDMSRLSVTNGTVTLESGLNRGIYINNCGRLFVDADCALDVKWPIRMFGKLWKEGAGTLVLGGEATFEGGNPKASYNLFEVVEGTLKVAAYNAIDGMETTFDSGTSIVLAIDPENEGLTRYGIRNARTETPFVLGDGVLKLPLTLDVSAYPEVPRRTKEISFGIVTVTNSVADAVAGMLPNIGRPFPHGYQSVVRRANDDGTVTFALVVEHKSLTMFVR